jgi:hypothetical protein
VDLSIPSPVAGLAVCGGLVATNAWRQAAAARNEEASDVGLEPEAEDAYCCHP